MTRFSASNGAILAKVRRTGQEFGRHRPQEAVYCTPEGGPRLRQRRSVSLKALGALHL